ncbi:hypothetical protein A1D29_08150 [Pasteurellaceae bacterium Orientalotternb1]|nr:hypothetical protein A1D29_08150 [Pasteurellaceae bacterium Orientalotternb1]
MCDFGLIKNKRLFSSVFQRTKNGRILQKNRLESEKFFLQAVSSEKNFANKKLPTNIESLYCKK